MMVVKNITLKFLSYFQIPIQIWLKTVKWQKWLKNSIGCIDSLALSTSRFKKGLFRNVKNEIILVKSNHLQTYKKILETERQIYERIVRENRQNYLINKTEISYDKASAFQNRQENFCAKRVMVKAGISLSISEETVLQRTGLKWSRVQGKGILTKNDLTFRLKIVPKVLYTNSDDFKEEGAGFYLNKARFAHKMIFYQIATTPRVMAWRNPGKKFYFGLNEVTKAQEGMLLTLWQKLHMERVQLQWSSTMVE